MKSIHSFFCFLALIISVRDTVFADLFVESVSATGAGISTSFDYVSTHRDPPSGDFHKVVLIVDESVLTESLNPSGTLSVTFDQPGTIDFEVISYSGDGQVLDRVQRSINVFGIAVVNPEENEMVGLGSRLFLSASVIFEDKLVQGVEFQSRALGSTHFNTIPGSLDSTSPYAFLYDPPSTGVWEIRAVAHHPDGGLTASNPVTLQVVASGTIQPSYATILDPSDGSSVQAGVSRTIHVDASSRTGTIRGVDMYVDGFRILSAGGSDITFPFQFDWTPLRPGNYSLVAIVTDNAGMRWASEEVMVVATDDRPHVELILPENGATFEAGKQIPLVAIAAGQGGAVERVKGVEFLVNGNAIPVSGSGETFDSEAPYVCNWTPQFPGQYFVQARVVDVVTGASYQAPSILVNIAESTPPTARMLAPYQGDFFYAGETVQLRATALDNLGLIDSLDFYINQVDVGTASSVNGNYVLEYTFESTGVYNIFARVVSDRNQWVDSDVVSVTVALRNGDRPTVVFTSPTQGDLFQTGDTIQIVASANDSDSHITQVEFFVNGQSMGEPDTQYPFSMDGFAFGSAGLYRFSVVATDGDGNVSQKQFVEVRAVDPGFARPVVSIQNPKNGVSFEVGNTIFVEVEAEDPDGSIEEVRFEINGIPLGDADKSYPFQSSFYTLSSPGLYRVTATAIDNEGYLSMPAKSIFYVVPASEVEGPQYDPLNDNRDFLTQLYLDLFSRGPTDAEVNRYLEKLEFGTLSKPETVLALSQTAEFANLRHSQNAYQAIMGEWPTPLGFASILGGVATTEAETPVAGEDDVGNTFEAATLLASGGDVFSGVLEGVGDVDVFAFQLQEDSLVTLLTSGPFDTVGTLYNSDQQVIEYDDDSGAFFNFAIQRALPPGIYYLSVSGWGGLAGTYTLSLLMGEDVTVPADSEISNAQLDSTIQYIYESSDYQNLFGPIQSMDSDHNRREQFRQLFVHRYALEPSLQQMLQGSNRILSAESLASFTASFVRNDRVGLTDYIYNLPDVSSRDDAAFLLRSLIKVPPNSDLIEPLIELNFLQKVETIFASQSYVDRFTIVDIVAGDSESVSLGKRTPLHPPASLVYEPSSLLISPGDPLNPVNPFYHIQMNGDGWKYVEWLGWISDAYYPWIYHETLGWIQVNSINPEELWVWHERLEWSYFAAGIYPTVYRYSDGTWVQLMAGTKPGNFEIVPVKLDTRE